MKINSDEALSIAVLTAGPGIPPMFSMSGTSSRTISSSSIIY